jgi:hypothetical protein
VFTVSAGANSSTPDLSPEYSWTVVLDEGARRGGTAPGGVETHEAPVDRRSSVDFSRGVR